LPAQIISGAILYNKFSVIFSFNHLVLDGTIKLSIAGKSPPQVNEAFNAILLKYG
jgi:hypothetical protein